jgi:predicted nucleic acid-binding protein
MSRLIVLDSGPLGLLSNPRRTPVVVACDRWLRSLLDSGARVAVPEIVDYEIRRELLRARKTNGLRRLDRLIAALVYLPITTAAMRRAAELWAQVRQQGQPTADPHALDVDVILAAQAQLATGPDDLLTVATTNVGHLSRMVSAQRWDEIV